MLDLDTLVSDGLLICPRCSSLVRPGDDGWRCINTSCSLASTQFPVVGGVPAIVDFERSVVSAEHLRAHEGGSAIEREQKPGLVRRLLHPANEQAPRNATRMLELLRREGSTGRPRVLVIGGGTVGDGLEELYADPGIDLVSFDVYASPHTQFVADGHRIPLADKSMDGVVIQAVLEHVLEPTVVVAEIHRVLRTGGVVYADTPFLQQVHEGPYDFTRFTESGHRYLFRHFERVDSGVVAGAGTALRWSIGYFVRALTRSVVVGRLASLGFFWLSWLDRYLDPKHSSDAASSVYFLGTKTAEEISARDIIGHYQGGMR
jgi:SAM-dependent methyltransferase